MNISIIVVCFNEENNIESCLETLIKQDYDKEKIEIIVVDGGSRDKTQDIVREFEKKHSNINLVVEPKIGTAIGRNAGIQNAKYDYIAFIDADCEAPSDWLSILSEKYKHYKKEDNNLIAVGGTNIPPDSGDNFVKAIGIALDSFAGSFSSVQGRQFEKVKYVESLANLNVLYEKDKLLEIGCFDESLKSEAEDADLNFRLYKKGYKFLFIPESFVWHKMRPTPKTWFKNMFRYGKGRARLLKRYPSMWKVTFVLPIIFILVMFLSIFSFFNKILLFPLFYFPLNVCFSIIQSYRKKKIGLFLHVSYIYIIQHFGYAAGEMYGLLNKKVK